MTPIHPRKLIPGRATARATAVFAERFPEHLAQRFYRVATGSLTLSSIGIGTYLGDATASVSESYTGAVATAIEGGINVIDTSLNYRHQLSERAIGEALARLCAGDPGQREQLLICTKAGYLVPDALPVGKLQASDIVGNMHSMAPAFLLDQLERSRENLGIETVDVFYLHNPETQLRYVDQDTFYQRIHAAFECLEQLVSAGRIACYGAATWDGYRVGGPPKGLSLSRMVDVAASIAGPSSHFRFVQLPFNLAMTEAHTKPAEPQGESRISVLEAAARFGITVVASASLLQARLAAGLPDALTAAICGPFNDAGRAIQFTRSAPGITSALVGMSKPEHVRENLAATAYPPMDRIAFERILNS